MRIYLLMANPDRGSFDSAIADTFQAAALAAGHQLERQDLASMHFDPVLHQGYKTIQTLEPDLVQAQELIAWCERWVIVYPLWWGGVPALLKGFFDRTLLPGQAFNYHDDDAGWEKLLTGRSAQLLITSDAPNIWTALAYQNCDVRMVKHAVLGFCGIRPVKVRRFDRVKFSTEPQRAAWLEQVRQMAARPR
ncbi:MAG: NAD(P)H-dependent oxidoreductase [Devosia sp.]